MSVPLRRRPLAPAAMLARSHGRVLLSAAVATMTVAAATLAAWAGLQSQSAEAVRARDQREWLEQARLQLEQWYLRERATVDATLPALDGQAVLAAAGVSPRWGARLRVGERVDRGEVAGRELRLWIPSGPGDDPQDAMQTTISGLALQSAAVGHAREGLERLARSFELGYRARFHADPARDVSINRFRAIDCQRPLPAEVPCVDDWTPLSAVSTPEVADAQAWTDPWGGPVQLRNDLPGGASAPHSLRLRVLTPWGSVLEAVALPVP